MSFAFICNYCQTPVYKSFAGIVMANRTEEAGISPLIDTSDVLLRVVKCLSLHIRYFIDTQNEFTELYNNSPLIFSWAQTNPINTDSASGLLKIHLTLCPGQEGFVIQKCIFNKKNIISKNTFYKFNEDICTTFGTFNIRLNFTQWKGESEFAITVSNPLDIANHIAKNLSGKPGKILFSLKDVIPKRSVDIFNCLVEQSNLILKEFRTNTTDSVLFTQTPYIKLTPFRPNIFLNLIAGFVLGLLIPLGIHYFVTSDWLY